MATMGWVGRGVLVRIWVKVMARNRVRFMVTDRARTVVQY